MFGAVIFGFRIGLGTVLMTACFAVAAGMVLPLMVIAQRAERRRKKMAEQFPVALDIFVRGLRAGHPVASALDLLTQEMTDPIGSEFGIVTDEVAYARKLSAKFSWAQLDVTRRSIEETAAAVLKLFSDRQRSRFAE